MPWSADAVSDFPFLFAVPNCDDGADDFVAGDAGERGSLAKGALLQETVGVADSASVDFNEDFAGLGLLDGDVFDSPGCAGFLDDDGATGLGNVWRHCSLVCFKLI
jgi:hypothetical protein